jgi:hypothetical protein
LFFCSLRGISASPTHVHPLTRLLHNFDNANLGGWMGRAWD